ncbi:unnamed protein product [Dovyalis caffra]|uniref:Uncharacterized protein n=1 Tax=Dovyalis caffra TaxID=77055 RepID=A0AAV1SEP5_9ROSI|nr:unnamed protein product [Dovyalis caffra]
MKSLFSRLIIKPKLLNLFLSTLKPFCTKNSLTPLPLKKTKLSKSRVKVGAKIADAAQLKQNSLNSLNFPLPDETETANLGGDDLTWNNVFDSPHLKVMVGKATRKRLDVKSIVQLIRSFHSPIGTTAYIEQSTPFPPDGKQGWWSGGFGYGIWVLVASGFSVVPVPSMTWKNEFELA